MEEFRYGEAIGYGSGKVILLGEHAVVHGSPAIALGLDRGVQLRMHPTSSNSGKTINPQDQLGQALRVALELSGADAMLDPRLEISTDLPVAMGFGSSAALAVALVEACSAGLGAALSAEKRIAHANEIEKIFHGRPSGIDAATATVGGVLRFQSGPPLAYSTIPLARDLRLALVETGTQHTTSSTVGSVSENAAEFPEIYSNLFTSISGLVVAADGYLRAGDYRSLGTAMTVNHGLLRTLGVSTPELDDAVATALREGALGAKLTGAGGGGAILALLDRNTEGFLERMRQHGLRTTLTEVAANRSE